MTPAAERGEGQRLVAANSLLSSLANWPVDDSYMREIETLEECFGEYAQESAPAEEGEW